MQREDLALRDKEPVYVQRDHQALLDLGPPIESSLKAQSSCLHETPKITGDQIVGDVVDVT